MDAMDQVSNSRIKASGTEYVFAVPNLLTYARIVAVPVIAACLFWYAIFGGGYWLRWAALAIFIAAAISTGSCAAAIPVFMRTASAPNSMARVASEAVPTPASTINGTPVIISRKICSVALF